MKRRLPFLPHALSDVMAYISPAAFEVIDWSDIIPAMRGLIGRLITRKGLGEAKRDSTPLLPAHVAWLEAERGLARLSSKARDLSHAERQRLGETLLYLYFSGFRSSGATLIDLRLSHFFVDTSGPVTDATIYWRPGGLWCEFSAEFRAGVVELYRGYYGYDEPRFEQALTDLGLMRAEWPPEKKAELRSLLGEHFGGGDQTCLEFDIGKFRESFHNLFTFLKESESKLSSDFMMLGIYLTTLYLGLEPLKVKLNPRSACFEAFGREAD